MSTHPSPLQTGIARTLHLATLMLLVAVGLGAAAPVADSAFVTDATIPRIQGTGPRSPLTGQRVRTRGVVTLITQQGFWLQDPAGDDNAASSDGIFVHTESRPLPGVSTGSGIEVTGRVVELDTGATSADASVTRIDEIETVRLLGTRSVITPTVIEWPADAASSLEPFEGMLVKLHAPALTVTGHQHLARHGQLLLGAAGRLVAPTDRHRPGSRAARRLAEQQARQRIVLDDASSVLYPDPTPHLGSRQTVPQLGDRVDNVIGVLDPGLFGPANPAPGDWRIQPIRPPRFTLPGSPYPKPPAPPGTLRVAGFSLQNFFTSFGDGTTADGATTPGCRRGMTRTRSHCRGAGNRAEFERQLGKILTAMLMLDADLIALTEIENDGERALQALLAALDAQTGRGVYASVGLPAAGTGDDAIRVALLYRPQALRPLGAPASDADPVNLRPTLAQAFEHDGRRLVVLASHFKAKAGCPAATARESRDNLNAGDGQGCWNGLRLAQARRLLAFSAARQAAAGTDLALLLGDLNAYGREDPIELLTGAGLVDLVARHDPEGHTHVFDGMAGRLDHAIATPALARHVTGASVWHINADHAPLLDYNLEYRAPRTGCGGPTCPADAYRPDPLRSSDHDPVVIGIDFSRARR